MRTVDSQMRTGTSAAARQALGHRVGARKLRAAAAAALPHASRRGLLLSSTLLAAGAAAGGASAQSEAPAVPKVALAPRLEVSRVIKGCWQLSGGHGGDRATDRTSGQDAVEDIGRFVAAGITTLDTADIYGPSESLIGKYLASDERDAPEQCQVLTKSCYFGDSMRQAAGAAFVERGIDGSRQRLGVEALDLVQLYWHDYNNKNYVPAALHLAELQAKGKIKHIGVTNFDVPRLAEIVDAGVKVVSNQVQFSILDPRPENGMVEYCHSNGVSLLPYGTVAGGFLTDKYLGKTPQEVVVNTYSLSKYSSVVGQRGGWEWLQRVLRALHAVGEKHGVGVAEAASRWVLQKPAVAGVILGARNAAHVGQHRRLFGFDLDQDDLGRIEAAAASGVRPASDCYSWERGGRW